MRTARCTVIDDCYNANPDSTAAALRSMATLPAGRRVAILGNMGELGANAAALHRATGACAAQAGVSLVITCGELAKNIAAGAAAANPAVATASFDTLDALLPALDALLQPGDRILGMNLSHGGHLTHGSKASLSGKYFEAHFYGVDPETETIDYDALARVAEEVRPKIIIAGASAYPRVIDFAPVSYTHPEPTRH
mgnify:CR=1 FL=1